MRGWVLAGMRRNPGPVLGTLIAAATAGALTVAAFSMVAAHSPAPPGRLAGADVVVAGDTQVRVTIGHGVNAFSDGVPLPAYRGVPAGLAGELARLPGVARATGETGFPEGVTRPGTVDLVAIKADPGVRPAALARRVRATLHGGYTVAAGAARGQLANPGWAIGRAGGIAFSGAVIPAVVMAALFALAATTALSVNLRRRRFALLRAVGATRGQVRMAVLAEQALLAVAGGLVAYLPGVLLGIFGARALAAHGLLPPGSAASAAWWLALVAAGFNLPVCVLSGLVAARRAARTSPARAVHDGPAERRVAHPVRLLLGVASAAGVVVLNVLSLHQSGPGAEAALALPLLLAGMAAYALLSPLLVRLASAAARPLLVWGPAAGLALAAVRALPRRTASATVPVVMAVGMIGAVGFSNTSIAQASDVQSAEAVTAGAILSTGAAPGVGAAPGGGAAGSGSAGSGPASAGLDGQALAAASALPGVQAAGISPLQVGVTDPDLFYLGGTAVSSGPLRHLLNLAVVSGHLDRLRKDQIAVSSVEASSGVLGVHVGSRVTVYLPDGTPYTATVSAVYSRSLALGDLLLPASATVGHTGALDSYSQILVSGASHRQLAAFAAGHPGVRVTTPQVRNAQVRQQNSQQSFGDLLILAVIGALAGVTMINTLAVSVAERRRQIRLLARAGATSRQLTATFAWQAAFVAVVGIVAGAAVCAGALLAITRSVTGTLTPYIPPAGAALLVATVAVLTAGTTLLSLAMVNRARPRIRMTTFDSFPGEDASIH